MFRCAVWSPFVQWITRARHLCACVVCCAVNSLSGKNITILLLVDCSLPCLLVSFALFILIICTLHTALGRTLTHTASVHAGTTHTQTHLSIVIVIMFVTLQITSQISEMFGFLLFRVLCLAFLKFVDSTSFTHQIRFAGEARQVKAAATHNTILKCEKLNFRSNCNYMYALVCLCHQFPMAVCTTIRTKAKES